MERRDLALWRTPIGLMNPGIISLENALPHALLALGQFPSVEIQASGEYMLEIQRQRRAKDALTEIEEEGGTEDCDRQSLHHEGAGAAPPALSKQVQPVE